MKDQEKIAREVIEDLEPIKGLKLNTVRSTRGINVITKMPYDSEMIYRNKDRLPVLESYAIEIINLLNAKKVSITEGEWILNTVKAILRASSVQVAF